MEKRSKQVLEYRTSSAKRSAPHSPDTRSRALIPWVLIIVTCAAFASVVTNGFGPLDDPATIAENPKLNPPHFSAESIYWFWMHPHMGLYVPVTYTVWGLLAKGTWVQTPDEHGHFLDARIFHAARWLAHVLSVLAVYAIFARLLRRGWAASAGALLFAIHPIQVEAVAWTSGLKDVMSAMFSLTAIWLYLRAVSDPKTELGSGDEAGAPPSISPRFAYFCGMGAMVVAMLCKPSAMVTPAIVAIIDLGILRRSLRQVAKSVAPWALAAVPLAIVAQLAQDASMIISPPIWQRPGVAGAALAFFFGKF